MERRSLRALKAERPKRPVLAFFRCRAPATHRIGGGGRGAVLNAMHASRESPHWRDGRVKGGDFFQPPARRLWEPTQLRQVVDRRRGCTAPNAATFVVESRVRRPSVEPLAYRPPARHPHRRRELELLEPPARAASSSRSLLTSKLRRVPPSAL